MAERITKKHSKTFYFASKFLEKNKRKAAYAIYAICRAGDDAVDTPQGQLADRILGQLIKKIESAYQGLPTTNPLLSAFQQTIHDYSIPRQCFEILKEGLEMDLSKRRYRNFEELYDYCYKVAGVIGLIMFNILEETNKNARERAVNLGIAMQLTNILRDIKEDYLRKRIYLPQDEMNRFGITEQDIAQANVSANFKELLKFQIARTRTYYEKSKEDIRSLTDPNSRFVVLAMADIYAGILDKIEKMDYNIFSRRAYVNSIEKTGIILKIFTKGQFR